MSLVYPKPKQKRRRPSKAQMKKAKELLKRFKQQRRDKNQLEDAIKNNPDVWDAEKFEEMEREKKRRKRDVKQPKGSI